MGHLGFLTLGSKALTVPVSLPLPCLRSHSSEKLWEPSAVGLPGLPFFILCSIIYGCAREDAWLQTSALVLLALTLVKARSGGECGGMLEFVEY